MKKDSLLDKILKFFKFKNKPSPRETTLPRDAAMIEKMLMMVENTDELELGCDEVLDLLDQYVELAARGGDVTTLFPLVKRHLDRCRDCFEEYEALMRIASASI